MNETLRDKKERLLKRLKEIDNVLEELRQHDNYIKFEKSFDYGIVFYIE